MAALLGVVGYPNPLVVTGSRYDFCKVTISIDKGRLIVGVWVMYAIHDTLEKFLSYGQCVLQCSPRPTMPNHAALASRRMPWSNFFASSKASCFG